jgi:hypothetical protein
MGESTMTLPKTRFFRGGRELTFREVVRIVQDHAQSIGSASEEIESLNWLVKAAYDGDQGAQLLLKNQDDIICAAYDGTSIWGETGHEWPGHA